MSLIPPSRSWCDSLPGPSRKARGPPLGDPASPVTEATSEGPPHIDNSRNDRYQKAWAASSVRIAKSGTRLLGEEVAHAQGIQGIRTQRQSRRSGGRLHHRRRVQRVGPVAGQRHRHADHRRSSPAASTSPRCTSSFPGQSQPTLALAREAGATIAYGNFITLVINFVIVAFVLFLIIKAMNQLKREKAVEAPTAPPTTRGGAARGDPRPSRRRRRSSPSSKRRKPEVEISSSATRRAMWRDGSHHLRDPWTSRLTRSFSRRSVPRRARRRKAASSKSSTTAAAGRGLIPMWAGEGRPPDARLHLRGCDPFAP